MLRFFVRDERASLTVPAYVKVVAMLATLLTLVLATAATALAGNTVEPNPFRWW